MFAALSYAGAALASGLVAVVSAIALPVIAIAAWGAFVAPRARTRWPDPARLLLEIALFAAACAGLIIVGHWPWAVVLVAAYAAGLPHRRAEASLHQ